MSKQLISLSTMVGGKERSYIGRFLGFIKDDEFNALIQNAEDVASRIECKNTQPLMEVISKFDDLAGHRLVMAVKKIDDKNTLKKTLFVTEALGLIDKIIPSSDKKPGEVNIQSYDQEIITIQEAE